MTTLTTDRRLDQRTLDNRSTAVEPVTILPQANEHTIPLGLSPAGSTSDSGHTLADARDLYAAVGADLPADPSCDDTHPAVVGGDLGRNGSGATIDAATPMWPSSLADPFLALAADVLDDAERTRIANENRLRQLTRTEADSDGEERGFGLDESHPDVARLAALVDALKKIEHDATLNLNRVMRKHPLGPWVKAQKGIGEKQAARLLATIGDPYWNDLHNRPRTVSELWAYCGYHVLAGGDSGPSPTDTQGSPAGVAARRKKGQRANWSTLAKTRAYLIASSCIKQAESPYRAVYDARREHTATTRPDWTAGHSHNDALRVTAKAILRDLWREAKRLHEVP